MRFSESSHTSAMTEMSDLSHITETSDLSHISETSDLSEIAEPTSSFVSMTSAFLPSSDSYHSFGRKKTLYRLVNKDGSSNVRHEGIVNRWRQILADLMTTLVELPFYTHVLMFAFTFFISWLLFALVWFTIPIGYGDHKFDIDSDRKMCIQRVNDFATALLFSIETQSTIGYGSRVIEPECPVTLFVLMIQLMVGMLLECFAVGLIYSKLSRTPGRMRAVRFSRNAVICQRNGEHVLAFRIWNIRDSQILNPVMRGVMVRYYPEGEGVAIGDRRESLRLETEGGSKGRSFMFSWPSTIVHKIDATSPFWDISAGDLSRVRFEIIITLDGTIESTGNTSQFVTSYLSSEIKWGYTFTPLVPIIPLRVKDKIKIDCSLFDKTVKVSELMTRSSAKQYGYTNIAGVLDLQGEAQDGARSKSRSRVAIQVSTSTA